MAHQNNSYNNYNNFNNSFNANMPGQDFFESQKKTLTELNQKETKLKSDIKFGVSVIVVVAIIVLLVIGMLIFGKGGSKPENETPDEPIGTKYIGDDRIGYLRVPADWEQFIELGNSTLMYADPTKTYIVAIDATTKGDSSLEVVAEETAKKLTSGDYKEVSAKKTRFVNTEAYLVSAFSTTESKWVLNWMFILEDNLIHIVSFETPNTEGQYEDIPQTFTMKLPKTDDNKKSTE